MLNTIVNAGALCEAWSDEAWVLKGAAVRVSMVGFGYGFVNRHLNGYEVEQINADLTGTVIDLTKAARLKENADLAFVGTQKGGSFEIPGELAREWLRLPQNPNRRFNSEVLRPWRNGGQLARRTTDEWIIHFPIGTTESEAAFFEKPFAHITEKVEPHRRGLRRDAHRINWWLHAEPRPGMFRALSSLDRYLATPRVAKHRFFVWIDRIVIPDSRLVVIAKEDDFYFGLLSSRYHTLWSLHTASWHGVGNDPTYNAESCFDTFPFPQALLPNLTAPEVAIDVQSQVLGLAASSLDRLREAWLNPPDLVRVEPEVVPGYPDRILPKDEAAAVILKTRTLTNLYNARPTWLANAHRQLDEAVAAAYGWPADLSDDEILARLFALNQERAEAGR